MTSEEQEREVYRRERIIDALELAASVPEQLDYQKNVPIAQVPAEVLCGWEDWMDPARLADCHEPVWSLAEVEALRVFDQALEQICGELPDPLPSRVEDVADHPAWRHLGEAAEAALAVMRRRGRSGGSRP